MMKLLIYWNFAVDEESKIIQSTLSKKLDSMIIFSRLVLDTLPIKIIGIILIVNTEKSIDLYDLDSS